MNSKQTVQRNTPQSKPTPGPSIEARKLVGASGQPLDPSMPLAAYSLGDVLHALEARFRASVAADARPLFVDDRAAAQALDTSVATVVRLAKEGAPHVILGERRRWDLSKLAAWLEARSTEGAAE